MHAITGIIDNTKSGYAKFKAIGLSSVHWRQGFWKTRFEKIRDITVPYLWEKMKNPARAHVFANFCVYAGLEEGGVVGSFWHEELLYKWIEAAAYLYAYEPDPELARKMDEAVELIARSQEADGYLCAASHSFDGHFLIPRRHELFDMGHLITAACIHHRLTGKTGFLEVAKRVGDCLHRTFVPDPSKYANFSNTKSYIMAVVDLYRTTGEKRYLELANVFIDLHGRPRQSPADAQFSEEEIRGLSRFEREGLMELAGSDIRQSRVPLRDERYVVGHAVNFTYLYASAADVYMETGDSTLLTALERLWRDLVCRKMYVNGGVCSMQFGLSIRRDVVGEAAGDAYELPSDTAYNETCAQIGNFMWNWRMLLITGEAKYADTMELNLYNSTISSVGMDRMSWFYMNPLKWYGQHHAAKTKKHQHRRYEPAEPPDYGHTCCPTNLTRMELSLHGCVYSLGDGCLSVDHYGASEIRQELPGSESPLRSGREAAQWPEPRPNETTASARGPGGIVHLTQETDYPWDGKITLKIKDAPSAEYGLRFRIPDWASKTEAWVNDEGLPGPFAPSSYYMVSRRWRAGDTIRIEFAMHVRFVKAHPMIDACQNQVAVKRGPMLYCLESADLPHEISVFQVKLPREAELRPVYKPDLFDGAVVLEGELACYEEPDWQGPLYREADRTEPWKVKAQLIPYYCWANRGAVEMTVWLPLD